METEKFDEAIRKKLDEIKFKDSHRSSKIDSIHQHVLRKQSSSSKKNSILFFGVSILIIGGLYIWNVRQVKEIRELKQKVTQLKDTYQTHNSVDLSGENKISKSFPRKQITQTRATDNSQSSPSIKPPEFNLTQKNSEVIVSREEGINASISINELKSNIQNDQTIETNSAFMPMEDSIYHSQKVPQLEGPNTGLLSSDSNGSRSLKQDSTAAQVSSLEPSGTMLDSTINKHATELGAVKNWQYGIGASFEIGRLQLGGALLAEAIFRKKWAISLGIKLLENGTQNFDDDDDFHDKNKNQFHNVYSGHVSDGSNKNIAIKNTILQVPLNVNYRFPVKRNFALLAGLGTDVDLYIRQDVDYKHANSSADYKNMKFATTISPVFLNNVVLNTGLQKTIHHFTFELSPYLSPQLKSVSYKKENLYYGFKFRTFFVF